MGGGRWVHSRETSGPRHSWCLPSAHLLRWRRAIYAPQALGAHMGKEGCRGQDGKSEREERAGEREQEKEQSSGKNFASSLSSSWSAWPAGKSFRITSHNLIMTLFQPLGVNKAFPSWTGWPRLLGRTFPGPAQGFPLPQPSLFLGALAARSRTASGSCSTNIYILPCPLLLRCPPCNVLTPKPAYRVNI